MNLGQLIANGKNQIYRDGSNAIKLFSPETHKSDVLSEALNTTRVEETGFPIPIVSEVSKIQDQWAITMNYIEGRTLASIIKEDPGSSEKYIKQMACLQLEMHEKRAPLLNKLKDKLIRQLKGLPSLDPVRKYELLTRLDSMPKHVKVCHGDFIPQNILVTEEGKMYVLDWAHAAQGNASADAARTYLLFSLENPYLADLYMDAFCEASRTKKRYVQQWLPIVAAAQLAKQKPEETELLLKWLDVVDYE